MTKKVSKTKQQSQSASKICRKKKHPSGNSETRKNISKHRKSSTEKSQKKSQDTITQTSYSSPATKRSSLKSQVSSKKKQKNRKSLKRNRKKTKYSSKLKKMSATWRKLKRGTRDFILITLVTFLIFVVVGSLFIRITTIDGFSMVPTLRDGDAIVIRKTREIERFDLVYFQQGNKKIVRRVIGLPGEMIDYTDDVLSVDGYVTDEKFIIDEVNDAQRSGGQYTEDFRTSDILKNGNYIPEGYYLLLGDNRPYGTDGRQWGMTAEDQIIGVVKMRLLPINEMTGFMILPKVG